MGRDMTLRVRHGFVVLALAFAPLALAGAQDASSASDAASEGLAPAGPPLSASESETLSRALIFDPTELASRAPDKPPLPAQARASALEISSKDRPDGSGTVTVKELLPTDWDAKLGADVNIAAPAPANSQPLLPTSRAAGDSTGAAWASFGLIGDFARLDARVDGGNDQGQLGTTFQHSLPLGGRFSLTLRDRYALSENLGGDGAAPGFPVAALPQGAAAPTEPVWSNQKDVKFNILPSGTTLSAGIATAANDPTVHRTLSAEQKLYGPLHVTTSVTDLGQPTETKRVTAGLRFDW